MELEKELLKSKKVYDSLKKNQDGPSQKGGVNHHCVTMAIHCLIHSIIEWFQVKIKK